MVDISLAIMTPNRKIVKRHFVASAHGEHAHLHNVIWKTAHNKAVSMVLGSTGYLPSQPNMHQQQYSNVYMDRTSITLYKKYNSLWKNCYCLSYFSTGDHSEA